MWKWDGNRVMRLCGGAVIWNAEAQSTLRDAEILRR
jgi:hypothetical protein